MLKEVENNQTIANLSQPSVDFHLPQDLSKHIKNQDFIGSRSIHQTQVYKSKSLEFFPFENDASKELWSMGDNLDEKTKLYRSQINTAIKVGLSFKYYQLHPVEIDFVDNAGKNHIYKPLALLHYWNDHSSPKKRKSLLIDIWSDEDIRNQSDFLIPAFRQANRFAIKRKLKFNLFRDDFFESDLFFNMKFIERYMYHEPDENNWNMIVDVIKEKNCINISELSEVLPAKDKIHLGRLIFDAWVLVGKRQLKSDWYKRFNQNTLIWLE